MNFPQAPLESAMLKLRDDPHQAVRDFRTNATAQQHAVFSPGFLESIAASHVLMEPAHLAAVDELLRDYPGIDAREEAPRALGLAAEHGNLAVVSHLFSKHYDLIKSWTPEEQHTERPDSAVLLEALTARRALVDSLPEAVAPVMEKPRARRL